MVNRFSCIACDLETVLLDYRLNFIATWRDHAAGLLAELLCGTDTVLLVSGLTALRPGSQSMVNRLNCIATWRLYSWSTGLTAMRPGDCTPGLLAELRCDLETVLLVYQLNCIANWRLCSWPTGWGAL